MLDFPVFDIEVEEVVHLCTVVVVSAVQNLSGLVANAMNIGKRDRNLSMDTNSINYSITVHTPAKLRVVPTLNAIGILIFNNVITKQLGNQERRLRTV